ncbi:MAG: HNH endonuclease signature motif containing protein [Amaricoccus sp.]
MKTPPTIERLHELLRLDPDGVLRWRVSRGPVKQGAEAFTAQTSKGAHAGAIDYQKINRARVVFAMHFGRWPAGEIRHLNGDNSDDRPGNLADAMTDPGGSARTWTCNGAARTSRYQGVYAWKDRWGARRSVGGRSRFLGYFDSEIEAARAYDAAGAGTDHANRGAIRSAAA